MAEIVVFNDLVSRNPALAGLRFNNTEPALTIPMGKLKACRNPALAGLRFNNTEPALTIPMGKLKACRNPALAGLRFNVTAFGLPLTKKSPTVSRNPALAGLRFNITFAGDSVLFLLNNGSQSRFSRPSFQRVSYWEGTFIVEGCRNPALAGLRFNPIAGYNTCKWNIQPCRNPALAGLRFNENIKLLKNWGIVFIIVAIPL